MLEKEAATLTHNLYIGAGAIGCHRYTHGQWWTLLALCQQSHSRFPHVTCVRHTPPTHIRMASCSWLPGVTEKKLATNNCYSIYALPQPSFTDVMEAVGQGSTALAHRFSSLHHHGTDGEYHSNSVSRDMHLSECTGGGCSYAALWYSTLNDSDHMHTALSFATATFDGLE